MSGTHVVCDKSVIDDCNYDGAVAGDRNRIGAIAVSVSGISSSYKMSKNNKKTKKHELRK